MSIVLALLGALALQQAPPPRATPAPQGVAAPIPVVVTAVRVESSGMATVTLENRATLTATAWTVRVDAVLSTGERQSAFWTQDRFRALAAARAGFRFPGLDKVEALAPGATTQTQVGFPAAAVTASASVLATMFEDGSSAGDSNYLKPIQDRREAAAAAAEEWLATIDATRSHSAPDAASFRRSLRDIKQKAKPPRKGIVEDHDVPLMIDILANSEDANLEQLQLRLRGIVQMLEATIIEGRKHKRQ